MATRDILKIDEDKCNGCGLCVNACAEGALEIMAGKARLVGEIFCDGMGVCLNVCPTGALTIEPREAEAFDAEAVKAQPRRVAPVPHRAPPAGGCPGLAARRFTPKAASIPVPGGEIPSALTHWPVQLKLIQPAAPAFCGADVLIAADCTAFALGGFHAQLLAGKSLIIACPKLDDHRGYVEKLTALFTQAKPKSLTIARMEVPCCSGIVRLVLAAREAAGSTLPVREVIVGVQGETQEQRDI